MPHYAERGGWVIGGVLAIAIFTILPASDSTENTQPTGRTQRTDQPHTTSKPHSLQTSHTQPANHIACGLYAASKPHTIRKLFSLQATHNSQANRLHRPHINTSHIVYKSQIIHKL
jgi:hypothetical protein